MGGETVTVHVTAEIAEGFKELSVNDFVDGTIITLTSCLVLRVCCLVLTMLLSYLWMALALSPGWLA